MSVDSGARWGHAGTNVQRHDIIPATQFVSSLTEPQRGQGTTNRNPYTHQRTIHRGSAGGERRTRSWKHRRARNVSDTPMSKNGSFVQ
jgi:hypothetical protein